jgi:plastocyanin
MIPKTMLGILAVSILGAAIVNSTVVEVQMTDSRTFLPDTLTINVGDTILWNNVSSDVHTSTSGNPCTPDGIWESGFMFTGATFSLPFLTPGVFPYYCIPHCGDDMWGEITVLGVGVEEEIRDQFSTSDFTLLQNKPNPFSSITEIQFSLARPTRVKVEIFNLTGQKIKTLAQGDMVSGFHSLNWDGRDLNNKKAPNGIYFYSIKSGDFRLTRMMVMMK